MALLAVRQPRWFSTRANWLKRLVSSAAVIVCITILAWALFNDRLVATSGLEWVPRVSLRMEFNSINFMVLFLPCTFVPPFQGDGAASVVLHEVEVSSLEEAKQ